MHTQIYSKLKINCSNAFEIEINPFHPKPSSHCNPLSNFGCLKNAQNYNIIMYICICPDNHNLCTMEYSHKRNINIQSTWQKYTQCRYIACSWLLQT